jgi:hypothetical protein
MAMVAGRVPGQHPGPFCHNSAGCPDRPRRTVRDRRRLGQAASLHLRLRSLPRQHYVDRRRLPGAALVDEQNVAPVNVWNDQPIDALAQLSGTIDGAKLAAKRRTP